MKLRELSLANFRNYLTLRLQPHERFNILCGDNGQGKTNLLEAIYYLSSLRSFRAHTPTDLLFWGNTKARLSAAVEHETKGIVRDLCVEVSPRGKKFHVNGKTARLVSDYAQELSLVVFVPDDVLLVKGAPEVRRRFLDRSVFGMDAVHFDDSIAYGRALKARNALLKEPEPSAAMLDVFDETLAMHGAPIIRRRLLFLSRFAPFLQEVHQNFAAEKTQLSYEYQGLSGDDLERQLLGLFQRTRARDLRLKSTRSGPHTDDLQFFLEGRLLRDFGSQGEQRSAVLAWKIAEILFLKEQRGEKPILLLDDVSSELDRGRAARFFDYLCETTGQVFLSTTDLIHIPQVLRREERQDFRVKNGEVAQAVFQHT